MVWGEGAHTRAWVDVSRDPARGPKSSWSSLPLSKLYIYWGSHKAFSPTHTVTCSGSDFTFLCLCLDLIPLSSIIMIVFFKKNLASGSQVLLYTWGLGFYFLIHIDFLPKKRFLSLFGFSKFVPSYQIHNKTEMI